MAYKKPGRHHRQRPDPTRRNVSTPAFAEVDNSVIDTADVRIERLRSGRWRLTLLAAANWAQIASNPTEVTRTIVNAMRETRSLEEARDRNRVHALAFLGNVRVQDPVARGGRRSDTYHPLAWRLCEDGMWLSPRGLKYRPDTQVVDRVRRARVAAGYAPEPEPGEPIPDVGPPITRHRPLTEQESA